MKTYRKKILWMLLSLLLIMVNQACGKIEESEKSFDVEIGNSVSSQKVSPTEEPINSSENSQIPVIETINYVIYNSDEIEYEEL